MQSDAEEEFEEILLKAEAPMRAIRLCLAEPDGTAGRRPRGRTGPRRWGECGDEHEPFARRNGRRRPSPPDGLASPGGRRRDLAAHPALVYGTERVGRGELSERVARLAHALE